LYPPDLRLDDASGTNLEAGRVRVEDLDVDDALGMGKVTTLAAREVNPCKALAD
jgi:hypothetical protein